ERPDRDAPKIAGGPVGSRAPAVLLTPALGFRHKALDEEREKSRYGTENHKQPPARIGQQSSYEAFRQAQMQQPGAQLFDQCGQPKANDSNEQETDVGRRADQRRQEAARSFGPDFHHQRHAQRPFASHSERRDKPQESNLPGGGRKATET